MEDKASSRRGLDHGDREEAYGGRDYTRRHR